MKSKHKITDKSGRLIPVPFANRKSIIKHAITGQRNATLDADKLDERRAAAMFSKRNHSAIGKNGYREPQAYSRTLLTPDFTPKQRLVSRRFCRNKCVANVPSKGKMIDSFAYNPQRKSPSRRDKHRMEVALRD